MVQMYSLFGRQVGSHNLAMATLATAGLGAYFGMGGSSTKKDGQAQQLPPINAQSKEEEAFVQEFLKNIQAEESKGKAKQ